MKILISSLQFRSVSLLGSWPPFDRSRSPQPPSLVYFLIALPSLQSFDGRSPLCCSCPSPNNSASENNLRYCLFMCNARLVHNRGWTATNTNAQKKLFTVCAIGPIRLLALASYRSLTNQILIFGILDLNFQSEFLQYAGSSPASSVLLSGAQVVHFLLRGLRLASWHYSIIANAKVYLSKRKCCTVGKLYEQKSTLALVFMHCLL